MSAICGIFNIDGSPITDNRLENMVDSMKHRGPDGNGKWKGGMTGLGHQKFCITPESVDEVLPYYHPLAGLAITADARIDNREELFQELNISYTQQSEMSDSMLILQSYMKWGKECPRHLLGEFVFVIWDEKKREMICVTDHMCNKPLYYYHSSGLFLFATEIRAIHTIPGIARKPDLQKIAMLGMLRIDKERTFFENIHLMPGASVTTINANGINKVEYWAPDMKPQLKLKNEAEYVEAFQEVFFKAVSARLRSDYPVAALYSGGLDSSAIVGTAAMLSAKENKRFKAYSAVLPENSNSEYCDERCYIDLLLGRENLDIKYITDEWRGPFDNLEQLIWSTEKPAATSRNYLYTAFAEAAASEGVRVILDGVGGELGPSFHGNGFYAESFITGHWFRLARELYARGQIENRSLLKMVKTEVIKPLIPAGFSQHYLTRFDIKMLDQGSILRRDFIIKQIGTMQKEYETLSNRVGVDHPNTQKNQLEAINWVRYARGGGGYAGYEKVNISMPFYDKRVIEFCLALPAGMKVNKGYSRYMIRAGMKEILPDEIRYRVSKEPFSPDYHIRYNAQRQKAQKIIQQIPRTPLIREIIDFDKLETLLSYTMHTNRCNTPSEFAAMHNVPRGVYLLAYLSTFN